MDSKPKPQPEVTDVANVAFIVCVTAINAVAETWLV